MPKYKFKKHFKTLIQIYLFYYFLNTINLFGCHAQMLHDVELITSDKSETTDFSDQNLNKNSDSDFSYLHNNNNNNDDNENNFDSHDENNHDDFDSKNVNLNVNNDLPDVEMDEGGGDGGEFTEINESSITGRTVLYTYKSPYLVRQDLEVQQYGVLEIEPGVKVHFAPMVGITVYGAIKAVVSTLFILFISKF
jgi:hypothetical protein